MLLHQRSITRAEFESSTGWTLEPQGACRGSVCIPLRDDVTDPVDAVDLAGQMGLPIVHDDERDVWAIGPWPGSGRALVSADAPELVLPELDGNEFRLSSLRGQKVVIVAWAPY